MAQRREKSTTNNSRETIAMIEPDGVIVHRRMTDKFTPFVPKLAVKPGVSIIELLRGDDEVDAGHGIET